MVTYGGDGLALLYPPSGPSSGRVRCVARSVRFGGTQSAPPKTARWPMRRANGRAPPQGGGRSARHPRPRERDTPVVPAKIRRDSAPLAGSRRTVRAGSAAAVQPQGWGHEHSTPSNDCFAAR